MINIDLVVGARPNFVKAAALVDAAKKYSDRVRLQLIHTRQHRDAMSDPFFAELDMPENMIYLRDCRHYNTTDRFAFTISSLAEVWGPNRPDFAMVVGDTDSTLAGALAARKLGIDVMHVEAGLRCGDRDMQEEINRIAVDGMSDMLFCSTESGREHLIAESNPGEIYFVGNVMADTLIKYLSKAKGLYPRYAMPKSYAMLTLHRAENVDNPERLRGILGAMDYIARDIPVIFPVHPRLSNYIRKTSWHVDQCAPMGYLEFIAKMSGAKFIMTDSGGVQEESTMLNVPCFTIRDSTERPETVTYGTNCLVGTDPASIMEEFTNYWNETRLPVTVPEWGMPKRPPLWDGHAADRIMEIICQ